jgi:hypothetical protein
MRLAAALAPFVLVPFVLVMGAACSAREEIAVRPLTLDELYAHLAPAAGERAVLVNFWATW